MNEMGSLGSSYYFSLAICILHPIIYQTFERFIPHMTLNQESCLLATHNDYFSIDRV